MQVIPAWAGPGPRPDARASLVVHATPDRGNGAFAAAPVPAGAFLGEYEGELLDEGAYWARYPDGVVSASGRDGGGGRVAHVAPCRRGAHCPTQPHLFTRILPRQSDYCIRVDRTWTLDGASRAADTARPSPCHVNHARPPKANVCRITRRKERKVELYASRPLEMGEEVLLDYGKTYWQGRESAEIV